MLQMRFLRSGRKNQSFFRIVLTENSKPPQSGFKKVLGWYNPHTKETSFEKEEILKWLNFGAKPSNSLAKILEREKVKHKLVKFTPKKEKQKKSTEEESVSKDDKKAESEKKAEENIEEPVQEKKESQEEDLETKADTDQEKENKEENK